MKQVLTLKKKENKSSGAYTKGGSVYARDEDGKEVEMPKARKPGTAGLNHSGVNEGDTLSTKDQKKTSQLRAKLERQSGDTGGDLNLTPKKKTLELKPKNSNTSVFSTITKGGFTPLGLEAKDSLQKHGLASAARTVARGIGKEFTDSFKPKKQPVAPARKPDPLPNPDVSEALAAADDIGRKTKARLDNKLKRMSQQITRGTPAANKTPSNFKKK